MFKTYKYRLYPNKQQIEQIQKTFGCCRFVYNQTLSYRKEIYETQKKSMNKTSSNNYCNQVLKKEYEWLKEVDKFALTNAIYNMDSAYQRFFKGYSSYPKFKSKRNNKKSYSTNFTNNNIEISFENNKIKLPKLKWVKAKIHREFMGKIKSATISQVPSDKYYVSIMVEQEIKELPKNDFAIGIDLGLTDFAITSDGVKYSNPRYLQKSLNKLAKEQRKLSRKKKRSKNRNKQRIKVAKLHEHISNQRKDFLHKLSFELINENQVICLEDLQVKEMQQNKYLSQSASDVGWYEFRRQLEYKAKWYGREISFVDKWYPSSQICSNCGNNTGKKELSIREFDCPYCGKHHDRDINASINILHEGLRILNNK